MGIPVNGVFFFNTYNTNSLGDNAMTTISKEQHIIDVVTHYMNGGNVKCKDNIFNNESNGYTAWNFEDCSYKIVKPPREFKVFICGSDDTLCKRTPCNNDNPCKDSKTIIVVEKL